MIVTPRKNSEGLEYVLIDFEIPDMDATKVEEILDKYTDFTLKNQSDTLIDMIGVKYINSTVLGIFLHFGRSQKQKGYDFAVVGANNNIKEIMTIIGADIKLYNTLNEYEESRKNN